MLPITRRAHTVNLESFDSLTSYWLDPRQCLQWDCIFVLPTWLKVWWSIFGEELDKHLCTVWQRNELLGVAPLSVRGHEARFLGAGDVCDYLDFVIVPGRGGEFFETLLGHLRQQGIRLLNLKPVRGDSTVLTDLVNVAQGLNCKLSCQREDVTVEMQLPATWDEYLDRLSGKERHEIRRKLRRLQEAAQFCYRPVEKIEDVRREIDTFLELFALNRPDKAVFMTSQMATFFRSLAEATAEVQILKLFFLEVDKTPAAGVMCFDYNSRVYLYNNGYDRRFRRLSVGLLSKVLSIKDSILRHRKTYDFLRGAESYKRRLGGKPVPLYRCQVEFR